MRGWNHYFFSPVAAVRPYLLMKGVLVLLAFDAWMKMSPHGSLYGAAGFNVAHFRWIDAVQPVPTPALHVGVVLLTGMLASMRNYEYSVHEQVNAELRTEKFVPLTSILQLQSIKRFLKHYQHPSSSEHE